MDATVKKPFSFSYSKLKSWEICPRRYFEMDVKKAWGEPRSEQLAWGEIVHAELANALREARPLSPQFAVYQPWLDKVVNTPGDLLVECRWAISSDLRPVPWMSKNVWLRSIADVVKLDGEVALLADWKTGASKNVDPVQLVITSLVMFIHFPKLQCIRSDYVWLEEAEQTTQVVWRHEAPDHWAELFARVEPLKRATEAEDFPPRPNRFCHRYCPVASCEFYQKKM